MYVCFRTDFEETDPLNANPFSAKLSTRFSCSVFSLLLQYVVDNQALQFEIVHSQEGAFVF